MIGKSFPAKKTIVLVILSVAGGLLAVVNFFLLSKDMLRGDYSAKDIFPQPMYGFFRVPDRPNTIAQNGVNRLAGDYAQVYFPSLEFSSLTQNYETGYLDPWKRPSRYAPFIHYVCALSFCKLDYGDASLLHMFTQMVLFYAFFIAAFKILEIESDLWVGLLITTLLLFVTPAGLSWFERGQFSLYVALAYLLLMLGLIKNKPVFVFISALFAYVKWTSFPFLFVVMFVHWMSAKNTKERAQYTQSALIYLLVILVLSLAFRSRFIHFLEGIYKQEVNVEAVGIALAQLLPTSLVKGMPILLTLLGYLSLRKNNMDFECAAPFLIGSGILMLTYPTVAFEYNIPNLFCFIPLIFYWAKNPKLIHPAAKYVFFIFISLASCTAFLGSTVGAKTILFGYMAVAGFFLILPFIDNKTFGNALKG